MVTIDRAAQMAAELPGVAEGTRHGHRTWFVGTKGFAWERPFSKADIKRFGAETPPQGPILAVSADDLADKAAVLAAGHVGFFDIEHFKGYPAYLIELEVVAEDELREAIVDGWLTAAPPDVAEAYLNDHP